MVRIRSKIEELYTIDSPNYGTLGKATRIEPKAINSDTLAKLISGITDPQDKALVLLLIDTGIRGGEAVDLNKDSVEIRISQDLAGSGWISGAGKTKNGTTIPGRPFYFTTRTVDAIAAYMKKRGDDGLPALFVGKKGMRLSSRDLIDMMHGWCDRIGIERIGPHRLRHHFAATLICAGGSPVILKELLGFAGWDTVLKYIPLSGASEALPD